MGANTEEARAAYSRREFACRNNIVLREARETLYWLRLVAANQLAPDKVDPLIAEANELVSIFTAVVKKARSENDIFSQAFTEEQASSRRPEADDASADSRPRRK